MSFEEILKDWKTWLVTSGIGGSIWAWVRFRKKDNADTKKTEAEADKTAMEKEVAKWNLNVAKDKYMEERELRFQAKIDQLILRVEAQEERNNILQKQLDAEKILVKELKAELTMYKTIKSSQIK